MYSTSSKISFLLPDVQSEPSKRGKKPATDEGDPVYAEPGNDYPGNEYAESQEPGLMDGTKQFRD